MEYYQPQKEWYNDLYYKMSEPIKHAMWKRLYMKGYVFESICVYKWKRKPISIARGWKNGKMENDH